MKEHPHPSVHCFGSSSTCRRWLWTYSHVSRTRRWKTDHPDETSDPSAVSLAFFVVVASRFLVAFCLFCLWCRGFVLFVPLTAVHSAGFSLDYMFVWLWLGGKQVHRTHNFLSGQSFNLHIKLIYQFLLGHYLKLCKPWTIWRPRTDGAKSGHCLKNWRAAACVSVSQSCGLPRLGRFPAKPSATP